MSDNRFRNRIVGVITLVIILICFLPAVFHKKAKYVEPSIPLVHKSDDEINSDNFVTAEPVLPLSQHELPFPIENQSVKHDRVDEQQQTSSHTTTQNIDTLAKTTEKKQQYIVQLVALKNARKIEGLVALLVLNNFSVFTKPTKPIDGKLTLLYVGPFDTKKQAESELIALKSITKLTGQVKIYR